MGADEQVFNKEQRRAKGGLRGGRFCPRKGDVTSGREKQRGRRVGKKGKHLKGEGRKKDGPSWEK